jgi:hypothetical protein
MMRRYGDGVIQQQSFSDMATLVSTGQTKYLATCWKYEHDDDLSLKHNRSTVMHADNIVYSAQPAQCDCSNVGAVTRWVHHPTYPS